MKCAGVIIGLAFALGTRVEGAEIKVISTGGARAVMTSIVPEFERQSRHKIRIDFGTPGNMRDRLLQGEAADVAVAIAAILPDLEKAGKIAAGTRMKYANHGYGLIGLIIEAITGEPYARWIKREIVDAAGLKETRPDMPLRRGTPFARGHTGRLLLGRRHRCPALGAWHMAGVGEERGHAVSGRRLFALRAAVPSPRARERAAAATLSERW